MSAMSRNKTVSDHKKDNRSRADDTSHKWAFVEFTGTQATQDAVDFLNNSPSRLGPGEASAGTVGVMYIDIGSLDSLDSPTWGYQNFPAGTGPGEGPDGVLFNLNGAPRQGAGEVCAIPRNDGQHGGADGSVGVFSMQPGSIDFMAWPTWQYRNFGSKQAAVDFLNAAPMKEGGKVRLGPGEATAWARGDGTVGVFYLERGPG
jgi:hypothetical protein